MLENSHSLTDRGIMSPSVIFRLCIALAGTDPVVFRVVEVPAWFDFEHLHYVIQDAMGWEERHLYEFQVFKNKSDKRGICIGLENMDTGFNSNPPPFYELSDLQLNDVLLSKWVRMKYLYDFGDGWEHQITQEGAGEAEPGAVYPRVVDGGNACPPEDCGGPPGYYHMQGAWKDRENPDYWWARENMGRDFDVTKFDLKKANKRVMKLSKIRRPTGLRIKPEVDFG